jgi:hypothetical protein
MKKYLLLFIVISFLIIPNVSFAIVWRYIAGDELHTVTDGVEVTTNSAPISDSTTQAHSGTHSWRVNAGAGFQRDVIYTSNQSTVGTIRIWYYPVARPNAATQFVRFSNAANTSVGNITMNTDGTLVLLKASGAQIGSASTALPLNQWSCVELQDDASGTGVLTGRVSGSSFATGANSTAGPWARALWGNVTGAQTTNDGYFDDIAVVDGGTAFPGCGNTVFMHPNAAGDVNSWLKTGGGAGDANNYTLVDETPPDDATSMVKSAILNSEDMYNFDDSGLHSYDTINAVVVGTRYNNDTADATTAYQIEYETSASGNKFKSASIIPNSTTWSSYGAQASKDDKYYLSTTTGATGAALTSSDLDSSQAGYLDSAININKIQVTNIWMYADYTAGTAPAVGIGMNKCTFFGDW